jgi:hypothetical protein
MGDDKAIIASNEDYNNRKLSPTDKALLEAAKNPTAPGNTPITSVEQFMEMAKQAQARMTEFRINIRNKMTKKRAEKVYEYYVNQKYSWRLLAMATWAEWMEDAAWNPPDNQLAGMALCEIASEVLKVKI